MSSGAVRARRPGAPDARVAPDGAGPAFVDARPGAMSLLQLQRPAGNAAVTGLVNGGTAAVQRGGAGARGSDRPGAKWPYGPISARKSVQHTFADYEAAARPTTEATEAGPVNETSMPGVLDDGQLLLEAGRTKTAKDDLLGDMDAQNLAAIARRYATFLAVGLANGDAPWL